MSNIEFYMNPLKIQGEIAKGLNRAAQKEHAALFDLGPVVSGGAAKAETRAEEAHKIVLKHYDGNTAMTVKGDYDVFPEIMQTGLSDIFAELKHLGLISSFSLDVNGWSLVLTASGLGYFDAEQRPLKKGPAAHRRLAPNTRKLLLAIVDSDDPSDMLRDRFEKSGYEEDRELLGMIRELISEGYLRVPVWKEDMPHYVEIDEDALAYEEPEDEYQEFVGYQPLIETNLEFSESLKEALPMKLGATVYVKGSIEAVPFYMEAFGLTLGYHAKHEDGTFWHAELMKDGVEIFSVSESRNEALAKMILSLSPEAHPTIGIGMNFETADEIKKAFDMLQIGGKVLYPPAAVPWSPLSAEVIDKYGVDWCIYLMK